MMMLCIYNCKKLQNLVTFTINIAEIRIPVIPEVTLSNKMSISCVILADKSYA